MPKNNHAKHNRPNREPKKQHDDEDEVNSLEELMNKLKTTKNNNPIGVKNTPAELAYTLNTPTNWLTNDNAPDVTNLNITNNASSANKHDETNSVASPWGIAVSQNKTSGPKISNIPTAKPAAPKANLLAVAPKFSPKSTTSKNFPKLSEQHHTTPFREVAPTNRTKVIVQQLPAVEPKVTIISKTTANTEPPKAIVVEKQSQIIPKQSQTVPAPKQSQIVPTPKQSQIVPTPKQVSTAVVEKQVSKPQIVQVPQTKAQSSNIDPTVPISSLKPAPLLKASPKQAPLVHSVALAPTKPTLAAPMVQPLPLVSPTVSSEPRELFNKNNYDTANLISELFASGKFEQIIKMFNDKAILTVRDQTRIIPFSGIFSGKKGVEKFLQLYAHYCHPITQTKEKIYSDKDGDNIYTSINSTVKCRTQGSVPSADDFLETFATEYNFFFSFNKKSELIRWDISFETGPLTIFFGSQEISEQENVTYVDD